MLYQLSYSGVSEPVRAATEGLIGRDFRPVQPLWRPAVAVHGMRRGWTESGRRFTLPPMTDIDVTSREVLDLRGLKCPLPVLRTRRALRSLRPGDLVTVLCTDPLAGLDLPHLLRETGDHLVETLRTGAETRFLIRKG